jgi:acyl carrier protein
MMIAAVGERRRCAREWNLENASRRCRSRAVGPESLLVDAGLTSMDMVNLMLGVEAEFDFTIPQSEITPENFQSVKTLKRLIVSQLQPATAA